MMMIKYQFAGSYPSNAMSMTRMLTLLMIMMTTMMLLLMLLLMLMLTMPLNSLETQMTKP
jgi:hypothetical protein